MRTGGQNRKESGSRAMPKYVHAWAAVVEKYHALGGFCLGPPMIHPPPALGPDRAALARSLRWQLWTPRGVMPRLHRFSSKLAPAAMALPEPRGARICHTWPRAATGGSGPNGGRRAGHSSCKGHLTEGDGQSTWLLQQEVFVPELTPPLRCADAIRFGQQDLVQGQVGMHCGHTSGANLGMRLWHALWRRNGSTRLGSGRTCASGACSCGETRWRDPGGLKAESARSTAPCVPGVNACGVCT